MHGIGDQGVGNNKQHSPCDNDTVGVAPQADGHTHVQDDAKLYKNRDFHGAECRVKPIGNFQSKQDHTPMTYDFLLYNLRVYCYRSNTT